MYQSVALSTAKTSWSSAQPVINGEDYGRKYINDFSSSATPDLEYMKIATANGIWVGYGASWENYSTEDCVLFFGAQFTNVLGGDTFGTNTIKFNTVVE